MRSTASRSVDPSHGGNRVSRDPRTLAGTSNPGVWWGLAATIAGFCLSAWLVWEFRHSRPTPPFGTPLILRAIQTGYLLEGVVLNGLVLLALYWEVRRGKPLLTLLWGGLGTLSALTALSMWSAGITFVPGLLMGMTAALFATQRCRGNIPRAVAVFLAGFGGQVAMMVTVIAALPQPVPR